MVDINGREVELDRLKEPFPVDEVKWRVGQKNNGRGLALAYIDSRAVMDRLDKVVGAENWQRTHSFGNNGEILCSIGILIDGEWRWKTDGAAQTNFEAEKGGLSDAFKRAGVSWGIGRYLYRLPAKWVDLENGRIKNPPELPVWARPNLKKIMNNIIDMVNSDEESLMPVVEKYKEQKGVKKINELNIAELKVLQRKLEGEIQ